MHGHLIEKREFGEVIIGTTRRNYAEPPLAQTCRELGLPEIAYTQGFQSLEIMQLSDEDGNVVSNRIAYLTIFSTIRRVHFDFRDVALNKTILPHVKKLLFCTEHDRCCYSLVGQHVKLVFDADGRYHSYKSANLHHA